ncbi:jg3930 [Pararge aegeria aegeria]|uniref:Jg3930 protein n=1 Tax=Pararge aegeria aegeria TaxID=348720 RepID=A0A8S4RWQ2_9NEOP|nr:jg3930 [Pararge aegeria aegeria]
MYKSSHESRDLALSIQWRINKINKNPFLRAAGASGHAAGAGQLFARIPTVAYPPVIAVSNLAIERLILFLIEMKTSLAALCDFWY